VLALVADRVLRPEPLDDLDALDEPSGSDCAVDAERVVLGLAVAETDPEPEPPAGEDVDRGVELGDPEGILVREETQRGREPHLADGVREVGDDPLVQQVLVVVRDEMFADPDAVEAALARRLDLPAELLADALQVAVPLVVGHEQQFEVHTVGWGGDHAKVLVAEGSGALLFDPPSRVSPRGRHRRSSRGDAIDGPAETTPSMVQQTGRHRWAVRQTVVDGPASERLWRSARTLRPTWRTNCRVSGSASWPPRPGGGPCSRRRSARSSRR
jgi:hypothetical protein